MKIKYDKGDGSVITEREIIPTNIPQDYISAFDVSDLNDDDKEKLKDYYVDYNEYVKLFKQNMFSFEDWLEHINETDIKPKWRRFTVDKTKIL